MRAGLPVAAHDWPVLEADSGNASSLAALAAATRVLVTTVGPYARHGLPVVEACARAGTHYADLTGEVLFVREAIDRSTRPRARPAPGSCTPAASTPCRRTSRPCCSPGVRRRTARVASATSAWWRPSAAGSVAARSTRCARSRGRPAEPLAASAADRPVRAQPGPGSRTGHPSASGRRPARAHRRRPVDGAVRDGTLQHPHRPAQQRAPGLGVRPGDALRRGHGCGRGPLGAATAAGVTAALVGALAAMTFRPTRALLDRVLPAPGSGPARTVREKGWFRVVVDAETEQGRRYRATVAAPGDPGYAATAVMLGESALALAVDADRLPDRAGSLTPATALGDVLVQRLRAAGHTYEVAPA